MISENIFIALPYFTKELPETTTVVETGDVEMVCEISEPAPVVWYKNAVEIPAGQEDYVIKTGNIFNISRVGINVSGV